MASATMIGVLNYGRFAGMSDMRAKARHRAIVPPEQADHKRGDGYAIGSESNSDVYGSARISQRAIGLAA